jgi:Nuclear transport factor 2 (NTF2) domain
MASDIPPPVNGMYNGQYPTPAELPAPNPGVSHAPSASQSTTTSTNAAAAKPDPQEIGWYFVEQYYTTLSKNPERIHLFYSKKSQVVIGMEAEKVVPAVGVKVSPFFSIKRVPTDTRLQAIGEKMKELDIQDCKVRVLNVDSQASFENIVVQVIGEMSNKSEPHHRFVQTFVLATQQNGYYVLNDIFRYLNDDEDEIIEDEPTQDDTLVQAEAAPTVPPAVDPEPVQEAVTDELGAEEVDARLEEVARAEEGTIEPDVNGTGAESPVEPAIADEEAPESTQHVFEETSNATVEEPAIDTIVVEKPAEPESTPARTPTKPSDPTPAADIPPAKKTWANMVGAKAPTPVVPVPTAPAIPSQPKAQKSPQPTAPQSTTSETLTSPAAQGNGWQTADHSKKQNRPQSKVGTESNALAYIKSVNEKIQAIDLRSELEKYGELKYFDVSRPRVRCFIPQN